VNRKFKVISIFGGVDKKEQLDLLASSEETLIVTATPGRLLDLLQTATCDRDIWKNIGYLVMDEADRLAIGSDLSIQVDDILKLVGIQGGRNAAGDTIKACLFSATFPERATIKFNEWISLPRVTVRVNTVMIGEGIAHPRVTADQDRKDSSCTTTDNGKTNSNSTTTGDESKVDSSLGADSDRRNSERSPVCLSTIPSHVTQVLHVCARHKKPKKLVTTLNKIVKSSQENRQAPGLCIIFFGRIKTLQYINKVLQQEGMRCVELHSQMNQPMRERMLTEFRSGKTRIMLATDIAARGIHVQNVEYVINYDFPDTLEQYVHRCGRAGRQVKDTNSSMSVTSKQSEVKSSSTVYSFFNRELEAMAKDVVSLLKSCNAWVDPNLQELIDSAGGGGGGNNKKRKENKKPSRKEQDPDVKKEKATHLDDDDDWEDGQFSNLSGNRIVLKRATHVSDASSDSEEDEDE